ncbi:hypothetical protein THAOC_01139, partial [Thalassiosira oceanica]
RLPPRAPPEDAPGGQGGDPAGGREALSRPPSPEVDEANVGGPAVKPVRMIFFIHVPFPTSQVFRELQHGEDLLDGMLQADVVGFHAFDHARHFLNASKRILGLTYESLVGGLIGVRHRGTRVLVSVSNVSVEADAIGALTTLPSVLDGAEALRKKHAGRSIISGIAVAQRLSGVSYKLLAFERLLIDYPVWHSRVVLLQRCLIPGTRRVDEADTLREVRHLVKRIQDRFGPEVIDYDEQVGSVYPVDDRLSIWMASRVMMHAPIREGLNLCPLEYIFVKGSSGRDGDEPGVVIASEFAAVSSILNGALRVNPYDIQMCVTSIDSALSMSLDEREARKGRDIDFVSNSPSGLWTRNVLRDLNDATLEGSKLEAIGEASPDTVLAREAELCLERLDPPSLEAAYSSTRTRVFIIDFNGTLVVKEPAGEVPQARDPGHVGLPPERRDVPRPPAPLLRPEEHGLRRLGRLAGEPRGGHGGRAGPGPRGEQRHVLLGPGVRRRRRDGRREARLAVPRVRRGLGGREEGRHADHIQVHGEDERLVREALALEHRLVILLVRPRVGLAPGVAPRDRARRGPAGLRRAVRRAQGYRGGRAEERAQGAHR